MTATSTSAPLPDEAQKARELRSMKGRATGLLLVATAIFVATRVAGADGALGYVEAGAEAAMVGGLADWFAVTALFRHPLRIPIPHTAIIPKRKDQIGRSLGNFVQHNFLDSDLIANRLEQVNIGARLGEWMAEEENARTMGDQAAALVGGVVEVLRDDEVQGGIDQAIAARIRSVAITPLIGKAVEFAVEADHHQALFDSTLRGMGTLLNENQSVLRTRLSQESPWWVPEPVDDRVFERAFLAVQRFINDIVDDPEHELRDQLDARIVDLADRLKDSPEMVERGEQLKEELLAHPEFRAWSSSLWANMKTALLDATGDPESELRRRLEAAAVSAGERLRTDPELQAKVDRWAIGATRYVAEQSRTEVADLIAHTVENWDAVETADRIELQVGRDLQFIRINGTVVGALAGLVIHALGQFISG